MVKKNVKPESKTTAAKTRKAPGTAAARKSSAKTSPARKPADTAKAAPAKRKATAAKAVKETAKPAARRTAARKPKVVSIDEMCNKLEKLIDKTKASAVKADVAVDVKVWGWDDNQDRHLYIEIKDGVLSVAPHEYNASSFEAYISYENMLKLLNGKLALRDAIASGALNANGNIPAALIIGSIF